MKDHPNSLRDWPLPFGLLQPSAPVLPRSCTLSSLLAYLAGFVSRSPPHFGSTLFHLCILFVLIKIFVRCRRSINICRFALFGADGGVLKADYTGRKGSKFCLASALSVKDNGFPNQKGLREPDRG